MIREVHKISRRAFLGRLTAVGVCFAAGSLPKIAHANVPSVELEERKLGGNEFEVTIRVFHKGNNFFHYVDRVVLFRDGEEATVWEYSRNKRPEYEDFSVTTIVTVRQKTVFSCAANCNLHGENKDTGALTLSP